MNASDYPITFPYGDTDYPYGPTGYAGPYHRGDDRYMPVGTPILVNGVQIGLSGQTGEVTGPHLHIGRFVGGADTNPNGQGLSLSAPAVITEVSSDPLNGNFVAINDAQGVRWVYLHMLKQTINVGQVLLKGEQDMPITTDQLYELIRGIARREPTQAEASNQDFLNNPGLAIDTFWNNGGSDLYHSPPQPPGVQPLAPGVYEVK